MRYWIGWINLKLFGAWRFRHRMRKAGFVDPLEFARWYYKQPLR